MEPNPDATVSRRRLCIELRKARDCAKLSQKQVAEALDWSPSKLLRIETGQVGVSRTDLLALLGHYGVTDRKVVSHLTELARQSKKQMWSEYKDVLNSDFLVYLRYEGAASVIRQFELTFIPGLLQTEEYARRTIDALAAPHTPGSVRARQLEVRLSRQAIIDGPSAPRMIFLLDEAVVRRRFGDTDADAGIARRQLRRLLEIDEKPHVQIRIVPFSANLHLGMLGAFVILEFPDASDDDLLFVENRRMTWTTRDNLAEIERYKNAFWDIENAADHRPLGEVLDRVMREL